MDLLWIEKNYKWHVLTPWGLLALIPGVNSIYMASPGSATQARLQVLTNVGTIWPGSFWLMLGTDTMSLDVAIFGMGLPNETQCQKQSENWTRPNIVWCLTKQNTTLRFVFWSISRLQKISIEPIEFLSLRKKLASMASACRLHVCVPQIHICLVKNYCCTFTFLSNRTLSPLFFGGGDCI